MYVSADNPCAPAHHAVPWLAHHAPSLIVGAIVVLGLGWLLLAFTGWAKLVVGADGRLSTSRTITAAWTLVVAWSITTVLLIVIARSGLQGCDLATDFGNKLHPLSDTYLLLLGGPFAALVLAKGITLSRLNNGSLVKTTNDAGIKPADLVSNDSGEADLVDFQFCLFNLIALVFVVVAFAWHPDAGLPAIPTALAGLTSASALAYTTNKAFVDNQPVINSVDVTVKPHESLGTLTVKGTNLGTPGHTQVTWDGAGLTVSSRRPGTLTAPLGPTQMDLKVKHTLVVRVDDGTHSAETTRVVSLPTHDKRAPR